MDILKFFEEVNKLKRIRRTGWIERGVKEAETVADHSFMLALKALVLANTREHLDIEKLLKMAIVHDIVESQIGDIIEKEIWPEGGTTTLKEKYELEKKALDKLLDLLEPEMKKEFMDLFMDVEERRTKEASFLKDVDKFETILQAIEYQKNGNYEKSLDEFWNERGLDLVKDPELKKLLLRVIKNEK